MRFRGEGVVPERFCGAQSIPYYLFPMRVFNIQNRLNQYLSQKLARKNLRIC